MKKIISLLVAAIIVVMGSVEINGIQPQTEPVAPCSEIYHDCSVTFGIEVNGDATAWVQYWGKSETFYRVNVSIYLEKQIFAFLWEQVDVGMIDDTWVANSYEPDWDMGYVFDLTDSGAGTYRAVFDIEFYDREGNVEYVSHTLEAEYTPA